MIGVPMLIWLVGYALNTLIEIHIRNSSQKEILALQSVTVIGPLRWLFGRKPVKGPILLIGFWLQMTAFISLLVVVAINVVAFEPDLFVELVLFYGLPMLGGASLTIWIWRFQLNAKG